MQGRLDQLREEGRRAILRISEGVLKTLLTSWADGPEFLLLPKFPKLPKDVLVDALHYSLCAAAFELRLYHESFDRVAPGAMSPILDASFDFVAFERITARYKPVPDPLATKDLGRPYASTAEEALDLIAQMRGRCAVAMEQTALPSLIAHVQHGRITRLERQPAPGDVHGRTVLVPTVVDSPLLTVRFNSDCKSWTVSSGDTTHIVKADDEIAACRAWARIFGKRVERWEFIPVNQFLVTLVPDFEECEEVGGGGLPRESIELLQNGGTVTACDDRSPVCMNPAGKPGCQECDGSGVYVSPISGPQPCSLCFPTADV